MEELLASLIEITTPDENTRTHVSELLHKRVLGGHRFQRLHNDLRYPFYTPRDDWHCMLELEESHATYSFELLDRLKSFLLEVKMLGH